MGSGDLNSGPHVGLSRDLTNNDCPSCQHQFSHLKANSFFLMVWTGPLNEVLHMQSQSRVGLMLAGENGICFDVCRRISII